MSPTQLAINEWYARGCFVPLEHVCYSQPKRYPLSACGTAAGSGDWVNVFYPPSQHAFCSQQLSASLELSVGEQVWVHAEPHPGFAWASPRPCKHIQAGAVLAIL